MESNLVLIVDDDLDTRELYKLVLEVAGFRVAEAGTRAAAIALSSRLRPDVIVTDWMLGDGDGLALCRALRRHGRTRLIPIIAATGMMLSDELRMSARQLGCEVFLTKPINIDLLVRTIRGTIELRQSRVLRAAAAVVRRHASWVRRQTSEASKSQKASAATLITASRARVRQSVALIIADDAGHYLAVNEQAAELTGYDADVLTTLSVADLTPEPQAEVKDELWHQFMASGAQEGVYLVKRRDGAAVPLRYVAFANIAPGLHLSALSPAASSLTHVA